MFAICNAIFPSKIMAQGDMERMWNIGNYCFDFRSGELEVSPLSGINKDIHPVFWYVDSDDILRLIFSNGSIYNGKESLLNGGENIIPKGKMFRTRFVPVPQKKLVYCFIDSKFLVIDLDKNDIVDEQPFNVESTAIPNMLTVCHANGNDIWLIDCSKESINKYLLTSNGLSFYESVAWPDEIVNARACINLSRDGTHFVTRNGFDIIYGKFDRSTANFTVLSVKNLDYLVGGPEQFVGKTKDFQECVFSCNNECLYLFAFQEYNNTIWQIDIVDDIPDYTSPTCISFEDRMPGTIPLIRSYYGPDGKTYMVVMSKGFVRALTYKEDGVSTYIDYQVDKLRGYNSCLPKQAIALCTESIPIDLCKQFKNRNPVIIFDK